MPEIFRMFGLRFFFWSREHEPIHVHIENGDGDAKFDILPEGIVLKENHGIKLKDIKLRNQFLKKTKN